MKLAEYWLHSKNQFRVFILEIFDQLNGLTKSSEAVLAIAVVLDSNDPIARSLTFRALGYLCENAVSPELFHRILFSLSNSDISTSEEFESILFITKKFTAIREEFAINICRLVFRLSGTYANLKKLYCVFADLHKVLDYAIEANICN
jgi:hypothetical protein